MDDNTKELQELESMLKAIDSKVKNNKMYKFLKFIMRTLPMSAFVIGFIVLFLFVVIAVGAMLDSIKLIKTEDSDKDVFYEETSGSGFFDTKKIAEYIKIENDSYEEEKDAEEIVIQYLDGVKTSETKNPIMSKIDMAKEHRLHWQLLASIDLLSGYGEDSKDKTIEKLSKDILPKYEYVNYYMITTSSEYIDVEVETIDPKTGKKTIKIIKKHQTTITKTPQIFLKSVSSVFFDISYEYEKVADTDSVNGSSKEYYILSNVDKKVNNRFEKFLSKKEFKNRLKFENILDIYDFGAEFPESSDFSSYILEYIALNVNINVAIRDYSGEGDYTVTDDNKMFKVPIKFKNEKSFVNKVYISSMYGERYLTIVGVTRKNFHKGIDFAIPSGTPIVASADGEVIRSDYSKDYGYVIEIKHDETYTTVYAHNARLIAKVGYKVKKGDVIALSGNTGVSTGPHLHFEIKINRSPIDPFALLNLK